VVLRGLKGNGRLEGKRVSTSPTNPRRRVLRRSHDFRFESREKGFEEAMVYHHVDAAVRYLESLGYRGRRAIFVDAIGVDVNGTREDNSWYSLWLKELTFGTGAIDDAEDLRPRRTRHHRCGPEPVRRPQRRRAAGRLPPPPHRPHLSVGRKAWR
jgi:hypothetical protein